MKQKQMAKRGIAWILAGGLAVSGFQGMPQNVLQVSAAEMTRQYFMDGEVVTENEAYDGYVDILQEDGKVTFTPVAAEGYEFSILNLSSRETDHMEELYTPLSRDYVKDASLADGNRLLTEEELPAYTISLAEDGVYENGSSYTVIPEMTAYFDPDEPVLNEVLLENAVEGNDPVLQGWLGGRISAGTEKWSGADTTGYDQTCVFDAGEGKEYHLTGAVLYGRLQWPSRFDGVTVEVSDDGISYEAIGEETSKDTSQNKYYTKRHEIVCSMSGRYVRISSKWKTKDISYLRIYGNVMDAEEEEKETGYQFYKDGICVAKTESLELAPEEYDGYVIIQKQGTKVTVEAAANAGYEFMLLNLTDKAGNVTTPLSKDYVKTGAGNTPIQDSFRYTFTVDEGSETAAEAETIGTVYQEMPEISVCFDPVGELVNDEMLAMNPLYSQISHAEKPIICWLDTETATLNAGVDYWDGKDIEKGDYVTYYAGEGKAFCLSEITAYSRRGWSDSRFTAVMEGSNDGENYETIFQTKNTSANEKYAISRQGLVKELKYRVLRISAAAKNTDVNLLKLYGTVEDVADEDLTWNTSGKEDVTVPDNDDQVVEIFETVSEAGFVHPGIGFTKETLENLRDQVREKQEPWYSYYKELANSSAASTTFKCDNSTDGVTPSSYAYDSQGMKNKAEADGIRAYTQALMYVITGNETYRSNAIRIIRIWEQMDPAQYRYFIDAHIHTGLAMYRIIQAAEILKYTSCQSEELVWTEEDNEKFISNVVNPSVNTFMNFNDKFMNQHNFPLLGTLSAAIFTDNKADYEEKVEWTTVNGSAPVPEYTGSIKQLIRLMTKNDVTGEPLAESEQHIQLVEMGRDLAHAGDDVGTLVTLARIIDSQKTKVDKEAGTVSNAENAVDIYGFLENRILQCADYFCQFSMGYDIAWTPVITEPESSDYPAKYYTIPSDQYQGRLYAISNLGALYYVYRYEFGYTDEELKAIAPYYMKAFKQRPGYTYYASGSGEYTDLTATTYDDWWIYIPAEVKEDTSALASSVPESSKEDRKGIFEMEKYFSIITEDNQVTESTNTICAAEESGTGYIKTIASDNQTVFSVYNLSMINRKNTELVSIRVRTNGNAVLELKKEKDSEPFATIQLPDTHGAWKNVIFDMSYDSVTAGQYSELTYLMYFNVLGEGTEVDFDQMNVNAAVSLSAPVFKNVDTSELNIVIAAGDEYVFDFSATDANPIHEKALTYELQGDVLSGAVFDQKQGAFSWNPEAEQSGNYSACVVVSDGASCTSVPLNLIVVENRDRICEAFTQLYEEESVYTSVTMLDYQTALKNLSGVLDTALPEDLYARVKDCTDAIAALQLLNPFLSDGTLDYPQIVSGTSLDDGKLASLVDDNPVTFSGDLTMKYFIVDFGAFYHVKASAFAVQPRNIWANRLAGCVIMGSKDGEHWVTLTEEAPYSDALEILEVKDEYQDTAFRYFKASSRPEDTSSAYAARESILSLGEFRIYGVREELSTKIREVSISSNASTIRNHEGNAGYPQIFPERAGVGDEIYLDIESLTELESLTVTIAGKEAAVEKRSNLCYRAAVTLDELAAEYNASENARIEVAYTYTDETGQTVAGDNVSVTTDGSSVFVVCDKEQIYPLDECEHVYSSWNDDGVQRKTEDEIRKELNNLWDNNSVTISDARKANGSGTGSYFIFDFGENRGINLSRVECLSRLDLLGRSTGTYVQGSNAYDNETLKGTWTTITDSSSYSAKWQGLTVNQHGFYRYIRIINNGTWYGNMSELRFYGQMTEDLSNAVDKTDLEAAIKEAEQLDVTQYTSDSVKEFQTALMSAKELLNLDSATQSEVDNALAMLKAAQEALVKSSQTGGKLLEAEETSIYVWNLLNITSANEGIDLNLSVKNQKKWLKEGADYSRTISKNGQTVSEITEGGTYTISVTGMNTYCGTVAQKVKVTKTDIKFFKKVIGSIWTVRVING